MEPKRMGRNEKTGRHSWPLYAHQLNSLGCIGEPTAISPLKWFKPLHLLGCFSDFTSICGVSAFYMQWCGDQWLYRNTEDRLELKPQKTWRMWLGYDVWFPYEPWTNTARNTTFNFKRAIRRVMPREIQEERKINRNKPVKCIMWRESTGGGFSSMNQSNREKVGWSCGWYSSLVT